MEPRGGTASYDKANDSYLLRVCSQGARVMRDAMAGGELARSADSNR